MPKKNHITGNNEKTQTEFQVIQKVEVINKNFYRTKIIMFKKTKKQKLRKRLRIPTENYNVLKV